MSRAWKRRFCWVTGGKFTKLWAELVAAVRRRGRGDGSDDDEDLGLPRSPPASPPTDKADKRHHAGISQSSCSDGSLLSVGSSEMDEDSSSGHHHDHSNRSDHSDLYNSSEPPTGVAPLSHSAAKHKMAVRPRRTHGAPRRKKANPVSMIAATALPITPELNEEMIRSTTPDVTRKTSEVVTESFSSSTTTKHVIVKEQHQHLNRELQRVLETPNDTKLKSSSLPPGLALSQLVGQSPAKLSIAENNTPRSSIKRSKSSTQDQSLRDSPKVHAREEMQTYHSEERMSKYRTEKKYAEETCLEKKSKSEKKIENEVIRSKKEESFFSRLLLRKSGKKSKKDQTDGEGQQEVKKTKMDKSSAQYKSVDSDKSGISYGEAPGYKPVPAERTHKTAAQKVFANQMHKRMDNKGAYVQDGAYKDVYSAAKVSGMEYNITDLKIAEETDKMLNQEIKSRFSRRDEFSEKIERAKRSSSKETIDDKRESFNLQQDRAKRPTSVQRLVEPFSSKAFISNEQAVRAQEESMSPTLVISDDEPPIRAMRIRNQNDYVFHSGSMPKNIPYFNPSIVVSDAPPIKTIRHQSSENVKHINRSAEHISDFEKHKVERKRESMHHTSKTEESFATSGMRSLGDEYVETRSSIGKSHSFRYASETTSISSQESQMPSLPAIVGISEPLLESWEVNYRRNVSDRHDFSKRVSARNYNILHGNNDGYDSLPSTDSSYLDSLKTEPAEDRKLFTNSIHISVDPHKRDSDISQIEAKIDDIISSPKPIIASILKSSSLDSVKSSPEKPMDDRRKTISVESALSHGGKNNNQKDKHDADNFISVTHINKEQIPAKSTEAIKNKSEEKLQKTAKPGVPEFLNIQLNRVDTKPTTNVVLTANITPKKLDSPPAEKEQETEYFKGTDSKIQSVQVKKESIVHKFVESVNENTQVEEKSSPINIRKSVQPIAPLSPSTPKAFFKRKSTSVDLQDKYEKSRTNSMSTDGSIEKIYDNVSMDQKSHSSFGSKSSIQSTDSNENRTPDRQDEPVVYRKKPILSKELRSDRKNDDEPELMKVFARRSLKIKDCEVDNIAQEIAEANNAKDENVDNVTATRTKILKNEFNASIKSRDSDKENEDTKEQEEKRLVDIAARVSQFGVPHYQRSVSINSVSNSNISNPKRESAPAYRSEVNKYKKEVSDSTPEKRLRNRTFPDPSNDRTEIPNIKTEAMAFKADTLSKRPWQKKDDFRKSVEEKQSAVIERDGDKEKEEVAKEKEAGVEAEASPQYKGILQMRAEWERRAKQGMTK
ncbi:protein split ends isoform X2 [Pectinophora gossypiella]|uniref:protein split ends isoform X2 n=1 Tax=Pectinophora gossypiella TaxID=13191 RepID=UPI00214F166C|nr:protein split ends isoform X2 [Pectinophora gossypiella]XP_049878580.1 protein split ends isoform X2 [Pectinophora gossypiella]